MDNELVRIVSFKDKDDSEVNKILELLKEKNEVLYQFLVSTLQRDLLLGVRYDVLAYVADHAEQFGTDQRYMFNMANVMCNVKIKPKHIEWMNSYLKEKDRIVSVDDFVIMFSEAVEKDIPIEQIQELFETEEGEIELYGKIMNYQPNLALNENNGSDVCKSPDSDEADEESNEAVLSTDKQTEEVSVNVNSHESDYAEMFHSLITVMSRKDSEDNEIHFMDENFKKIVAKFQLATSELTSYSLEIIHKMEKDKDEIERLNALLTIQQRVMSNQQNKINELRSQIAHLNSRLWDAEKTEMRREEINQKITELQNLTLHERKEGEYPYIYGEIRR